MSDKKRFSVIPFSGKPEDYDCWPEKELAKAEVKGYKKLFLCRRNDPDYAAVPTESVYLAALAKEENERSQRDKNVIELWKLNQKAFTDLILKDLEINLRMKLHQHRTLIARGKESVSNRRCIVIMKMVSTIFKIMLFCYS